MTQVDRIHLNLKKKAMGLWAQKKIKMQTYTIFFFKL